jgi:hypothetical protein
MLGLPRPNFDRESWLQDKEMMADVSGFLAKLEQFDAREMSDELVEALGALVASDGFNEENMKIKSHAATNLCAFVVNSFRLNRICAVAQPDIHSVTLAHAARLRADLRTLFGFFGSAATQMCERGRVAGATLEPDRGARELAADARRVGPDAARARAAARKGAGSGAADAKAAGAAYIVNSVPAELRDERARAALRVARAGAPALWRELAALRRKSAVDGQLRA